MVFVWCVVWCGGWGEVLHSTNLVEYPLDRRSKGIFPLVGAGGMVKDGIL